MSFARLTLTMKAVAVQAQATGEELRLVGERSAEVKQQVAEDVAEVERAFDAVRQSMLNTLQVSGSGKELADQMLASFLGGIPQLSSSRGSTRKTRKKRVGSALQPTTSSASVSVRLPTASPTERSSTTTTTAPSSTRGDATTPTDPSTGRVP